MMKKAFCAFVILLAASVMVSELSLLSPKSQILILFIYFLAGLGVGMMGYLEGCYTGSKSIMLVFLWPGIIVHSWQEWFMQGSPVEKHNEAMYTKQDTFIPWYMKK